MKQAFRLSLIAASVLLSIGLAVGWVNGMARAGASLPESAPEIAFAAEAPLIQSPEDVTGTGFGYQYPNDSLTRVGNNLYLYGGGSVTSTSYNQLMVWNNATQSFDFISCDDIPTPTQRTEHAAAAFEDQLYILGGKDANGQKLNDVWRYNPASNTWEQAPQETRPPGRSGHTAVGANGQILVYGGQMAGMNMQKYVWRYSPATGYWSVGFLENSAGDKPGVAMGRLGQSVYLVGSVTGTISAGDDFLQRTDLNGNEYFNVPVLSTQKPSRRVFQATAFDEASSSIYIFGGQNAETGAVLSDTWQFNTDTSAWTRLSDLPFPATGILAAAWYPTGTATTPAMPSAPFADGMRIMLVGGLDAQGAHIPNAYIFDGQDYQPIEIGPAKTDYKIFLPLAHKS